MHRDAYRRKLNVNYTKKTKPSILLIGPRNWTTGECRYDIVKD